MKQLIQNIKVVLITEDSHTMAYISVAVQKMYRTEIVIFIIKGSITVSINSMNKGIETKLRDDPIEIKYDRSSEKSHL